MAKYLFLTFFLCFFSPYVSIAQTVDNNNSEPNYPEPFEHDPQANSPTPIVSSENTLERKSSDKQLGSFFSKPSFAKNDTTGGHDSSSTTRGDALNVSLGLIFILIIIFSLAWFMKKMGYSQLSGQGQLQIVASLNLGTKEKIALVQVGEKQLLVGMTATQINTLYVLDEPLDKSTLNNPMTQDGVGGKNHALFADKLSAFIKPK
ncbi:MAG: flagellar biosynthetic protein FliO [Gammaproteobacteria bacterium]|nr:flagellar biosynthetic protein FliO [Gammaproteobacteria bacterium]